MAATLSQNVEKELLLRTVGRRDRGKKCPISGRRSDGGTINATEEINDTDFKDCEMNSERKHTQSCRDNHKVDNVLLIP